MPPADRTGTNGVDRPGIEFILFQPQVQITTLRKSKGITRNTRRVNTIEQVDAVFYGFQNIVRSPYAHQVTGLRLRQLGCCKL